ncbi:sugar phosphate permease [Brevibacterium sanguinis]|uniref:Sugar phosphate permease n=2 Tax=Brevibacterium TaxID=1696 RepID=A0A366IKB3_9MICO|nr:MULTISPECIES: MFS transporter [Brevibacterium]RBP65731.1 sugar phosphate permease [Brevibacterium sanguinis]RBP72365.1 sugar phosphate permease [Brevibacterium celere]
MAINNRASIPLVFRSVVDWSDPISWPSERQDRYGWVITMTLFFFMMLNWADKAVLGLAAVPIMEDLDISPEAFGLVSSAMFFTFILAQILAAPLVDRIPTKWLLLVLCLIWSLAQLPIIFLASLPALWVGRLILGAGEGPSSPVILHGIYKWFPEEKRAAPGAVASVGAMVGLVVFAPVLSWAIVRFGWISAFVVLALAGVVLCGIWLVIGKEGPIDRQRSPGGPAPAGAGKQVAAPELTLPLWRTILTPTWTLTLLTSFFAYWTFTVALSWAPAYFQTVLHLPGEQAGGLIGLIAVWGCAAMLALSGLSQRLQKRGVVTRRSRARVLGCGAIVSGVALLGAIIVSETWISVALMAVGFGTAPALFPLSLLITTELTLPSKRGTNLSLANAAQTSAGIVAPAVSGFIIGGASSGAAGYTMAFAVAAGLTLVAGILCVLFVDQQRDRRRLGLTDEADDPAGLAKI